MHHNVNMAAQWYDIEGPRLVAQLSDHTRYADKTNNMDAKIWPKVKAHTTM